MAKHTSSSSTPGRTAATTPPASTVQTRRLEPELDQIPAARRFVLDAVRVVGGPQRHPFVDDLALAASEAITNAVEHAGTPVVVTIERRGESVRVSVHDDDHSVIPSPRAMPGVEGRSGRGLAIIDALAADWGVDLIQDDGKTLWFELAFDGPSPS